jgi:ribosome-associated protein
MNEEQEIPEQEEVSKSEIKRELQALQALGERLAGLKPALWAQFGFSPTMLEALEESRRIQSHIALRRHIRRLGKLLWHEDKDQVQQLFERMDNAQLEENRRFHRLEQWRERLLEGGDPVLKELLDRCPEADSQHLRQLIRQGRKELELQKPPAASRKLFKYLRELDID